MNSRKLLRISNAFKMNPRDLSYKKLFTPGPLSTSLSVKETMLKDLGSRDPEFIDILKFVHKKIIDVSGVSKADNYVPIIVQGSGTFGVESVIQTSTVPNKSRYLILENGAYGQRMAKICKLLNIPYQMESFPEDRTIDISKVEEILKKDNTFTHVSIVQSETTSGVLNQVEPVGQLVKKYIPNSIFIVDTISSFPCVPLNVEKSNIDFLIGSSNKCIQSVPGFAFVIGLKEKLLSCKDNSRSLCLDLYDQHVNMQKTSQFRFTPPVHSILAFRQALLELDIEGGPLKRYERYCNNHKIVRDNLTSIGFKDLVPLEEQSRIINSFYYPKNKNFSFDDFYQRLSRRGLIIYPGKITKASCFRIGNIGDLHTSDMLELVNSIKEVLHEMNIPTPVES